MRRLIAIIRNEIQREFAHPMNYVFFLVLPLLFTAAVGAGLGGMMGGDNKPTEFTTTVYVTAPEDDVLADAFINALEQTNLTTQRVAELPQDVFGLEIPYDITARTQAGETVTVTLHTLPSSSSSFAVKQAAQAAQTRTGAAIMVVQSASSQNGEQDSDTYTTILAETLHAAENPRVVPDIVWSSQGVAADGNTSGMATSGEQASAGQIVTWVQITLLGASEVFVNERENGTLRRLLISPMKRTSVLVAKVMSRLALGLMQMAILLVGGTFIFGVNWGTQPLAVGLVSLTFAMATVTLGTLLATLVRTRSQASSLTVGMSMAFSALGGAWFPLEITPPVYQQIVQILPSNWAMRAYTRLLVDTSANLSTVLPHCLILLAFTMVFTVLASLRFKHLES